MIVVQPVEKLWAWLNSRIGVPWSSDFRAVGLVRGGCLCAVVGYNGFTGRVCFMHSAIDDPTAITRTFVRKVFEFPFETCGVVQVLAPVPTDNEKAMKLDLHVGFETLTVLSGADQEGKDMALLSMRRESCKWLGESSHGRKAKFTPACTHSAGSS